MSTTAVAPEDTWMSIPDAAEKLGVHSRTLRRYIADGRLIALRLSSQIVRITEKDLNEFLKENVLVATGTGNCYVPRPLDM
jgi:excisionase family DNA binding protein